MNKLWKFYWDCGRQGSVEGVFIATETEVKNAIGCTADFGEILGKHSDVYGTIEEGDIKELKVSQSTIVDLIVALGCNISGYNPLDYIERTEMCSKCEDIYSVDEVDLYVTDSGHIICDYCATKEEQKTLNKYE